MGFPLVSPAVYKDDYRTSKNVLTISGMFLDLDHLPGDRALEIIKVIGTWGWQYVIYSSHSSNHETTATDVRFRVIFPYTREITPAEHKALWGLFKQVLPEIDDACKDPGRAYFLPECKPEAEPFAWVGDGTTLDPDGLLARTPASLEPVAHPSEGTPISDAAFLRVCKRLARGKGNTSAAFEALIRGAAFAPAGQRDNTLFAMIQDLAAELPGASAVSISKHFESSLSLMASLDDSAPDIARVEYLWARALERRAENPIDLMRSASGAPSKCATNAHRILMHDPEMQGVFGLNQFTGRIEILKPPPWDAGKTGQLTDNDLFELESWAMGKYRLNYQAWLGAVSAVAEKSEHSYHPVKRFIESTTWDGVPRLDRWLIDVFGCEDNTYTRKVAARWMLQAVQRIYEPGCQADYVLVLEGKQGVGKSRTLSLLVGDDWYSNTINNLGSREAAMHLAGKWIVELAELASVRRSDNETTKNFLTTRSDRYRLPYAKMDKDFQRQCVFAATVNPTGEYLTDLSGNRRYWPITVSNQVVDFEKVVAIRAQLWAEAKARYDAGEKHWTNPATDPEFTIEASKREVSDMYEETIGEWLENPVGYRGQEITTRWVLRNVLCRENNLVSRSDEARVVQAMVRLGFTRNPKNRRQWLPKDPIKQVKSETL